MDVAAANPNTTKINKVISIHIILALKAIFGILLFYTPALYKDYGSVFLYIALIGFFLSIFYFRSNLLFQVRLALLGAIGLYVGIVKAIDPSLAFSPVSIEFQSLETGAKILSLTMIALPSAFWGLILSRKIPGYTCDRHCLNKIVRSKYIFLIAALGVLVTGYYSAVSYGPSVFTGVYASGEGEGQLLGNLQSIGVVLLTLCFIIAHRIQRNRTYVFYAIILSLYYFVWGIFIRGGRLEVVSGILTIIICLQAANGTIASFRLRHYMGVAIFALIMEIWGYLRSILAAGFSSDTEGFFEMYKRLAESGIIFAGTISGISTTFSNTIEMVNGKLLDMKFGMTYLEYILRTPPAFLYPDRPQDLSLIFEQHGIDSIGGFFELAEAYYNFGVFGCFLMPMLVSFIIGAVYYRALSGSFLYLMTTMGIVSVFFRGAWYQNFAFYKGALTGIVLYIAIQAIFAMISILPKYSQQKIEPYQ